ncbi:MAG: hypothetical protein HFJ28_00855 [Clostridia bacterium]|nr:hypothetical protein [Clostridia bacterium]
MGKIILIIIGLIIVTLGVVCIFDARILTQKMFSFGDQNEGSMGLKIFGFLFAVVGAILIYFNI